MGRADMAACVEKRDGGEWVRFRVSLSAKKKFHATKSAHECAGGRWITSSAEGTSGAASSMTLFSETGLPITG